MLDTRRYAISLFKMNLLAMILAVSLSLDIVNYFVDKIEGLTLENSISFYFKGFVQFFLIVYLFVKNIKRYLLWIVVGLLIIPLFWLCNYYFIGKIGFNDFFTIIRFTTKFFYSIILYIFITSLPNIFKRNAFVLFEWIYILSALLVVFSFIFSLSFFSTYGLDRFGYKPLIASQNEASFWWVIGVVYFFRKYDLNSNILNLAILVLVSIGSILLGTKAVVLFFLFFIFYLVLFSSIQLRIRVLGCFAIVMFLVVFLYFSGIFEYFFRLYKEQGLYISLTSYRSLLVKERVPEILSNWSWSNYLFGGVSSIRRLTEMDIVDIFLLMGVVGLIGYVFLLTKSLFDFESKNKLGWLLFFSYIIIGALAGHVYQSGVSAIYLAMLSSALVGQERCR